VLTYNFAYGGATTNASIVQPYTPTVLSLVDQVAQFSGSVASKPAYAPWTAQNALFGVWIGVNDVGNSWWLADWESAVLAPIMDTYFGRLQVLYDAGARNFVLLSVPRMFHLFFFLFVRVCGIQYWELTQLAAIYRTPAVIEQGPDAQQGEKAAIAKYNDAIATWLAAFKTKNSGVTAKVVDTTVPFNTALDNPTAYGAPDNTCFNSDGKSCLWFNDYHPGIEINRLVAKAVADAWKGSFF
jgi:phospholipase/lecithinase/hemolysin